MKFQFVRLYLLILLIASLVVFSFSKIYQQLYPSEPSYQVSVSQIFSLLHKNTFQKNMKLVSKKTVSMPFELEKLLQQGQIIKLVDDENAEYYYQNSDELNYHQFGPFFQPKKKPMVMKSIL